MSLTSSTLFEILIGGTAFVLGGSNFHSAFFQFKRALFVRVVLGTGNPRGHAFLALGVSGATQN